MRFYYVLLLCFTNFVSRFHMSMLKAQIKTNIKEVSQKNNTKVSNTKNQVLIIIVSICLGGLNG